MPRTKRLYEFTVVETNGDKEDSTEKLVQAYSFASARAKAHRYIKNWYGDERTQLDPGKILFSNGIIVEAKWVTLTTEEEWKQKQFDEALIGE